MTSTVTEVVEAAIRSNDHDAISTTVGVLVIALLMLLLATREATRAYALPHSTPWVHALGTLAGPLLLAFTVVVGLRLMGLLL